MRRLLCLAAALLLAGCVTGGEPASSGRPRDYSVGDAGGAGKRLIPYTTLAGYLRRSGGGESSLFRAVTGVSADRPIFSRPMAVGVSDAGVYVVDDGFNALFRFRWGDNGERAEFGRLMGLSSLTEPTDLYVAPGGDLFIADGDGKRVVRYSAEGKQLQTFEDEETLNRPVAVTTASKGMRILVADGLYDRIVVFNTEGKPLYGIGGRGNEPGDFRAIRAMVQAPDGMLYVVDGIHRRISVFGIDGSFLTSFGQSTFTDPGGVAIDDEGRLYISDRFNHRVLVFRNRTLVETYGTQGLEPGQFNQPAGLSFHDGKLYVADRGNARVQVFRVVPERLVKEGAK